MARVGFIGLGNMGYPMAGHLAQAGHDVVVYNRTSSVTDRWMTDFPGHARADNPASAASESTYVFTCVGGDDDVRQVTTGPSGALSAMSVGTVLVDHTTASVELAREIAAACADRRVRYLDAPVSGGQGGAQGATLTVMCGGDKETLAAAAPILDAYSSNITHVGPAGNGQLTKMVNQILCAAAVQGAAEALAFGERAGLDMDAVLDAVTKGAANSWYLENRGHTMVRDEFDFGFAVDWMRKDLGLCLAAAANLGADLPTASLVDGELAEMQRRGANRLDVTSVIRTLRD